MKTDFVVLLSHLKKSPTAISILIFILFSIVIWSSGYASSLSLPDTQTVKWYTLLTYPFSSANMGDIAWGSIWIFFTIKLYMKNSSFGKFILCTISWTILGGVAFSHSYILDKSEVAGGFLYGITLPMLCCLAFLSTSMPDSRVFIFQNRMRLWVLSSIICIWYAMWHFYSPFPSIGITYSLMPASALGAGFILHLAKKIRGKDCVKNEKTMLPMSDFYENISCKNEEQRKLDAILDKISKVGYSHLSKSEKDFLHAMSAKDK